MYDYRLLTRDLSSKTNMDSNSHAVDLDLSKLPMIKKRTRPQPRVREVSPEAEGASNNSAGEKGEEKLE